MIFEKNWVCCLMFYLHLSLFMSNKYLSLIINFSNEFIIDIIDKTGTLIEITVLKKYVKS